MAKYIINIEDGEADENNNGELCVTAIINDRLSVKKLTPYEEPKQEKPGQWRGKDYWYVDHLGEIKAGLDGRLQSDNWRYVSGNYFKTKEEAEEYRESLIAYNELKAFAEPDNALWDGWNSHFNIAWRARESKMEVVTTQVFKEGGTVYFATRKDAQDAIEVVGEERIKRFYLGIKED